MVLWEEGGRSWSWRSHLDNGGGNQRVRGKTRERQRGEKTEWQSGWWAKRNEESCVLVDFMIHEVWHYTKSASAKDWCHRATGIASLCIKDSSTFSMKKKRFSSRISGWCCQCWTWNIDWLIFPFSNQQKNIWRHPHLENEICDCRRNTQTAVSSLKYIIYT